jgi:hypothetical protein
MLNKWTDTLPSLASSWGGVRFSVLSFTACNETTKRWVAVAGNQEVFGRECKKESCRGRSNGSWTAEVATRSQRYQCQAPRQGTPELHQEGLERGEGQIQ